MTGGLRPLTEGGVARLSAGERTAGHAGRVAEARIKSPRPGAQAVTAAKRGPRVAVSRGRRACDGSHPGVARSATPPCLSAVCRRPVK